MKKNMKASAALAVLAAISLMACGGSKAPETTAAAAPAVSTAAETKAEDTTAAEKKSDYPKMAITINTSKSGSSVDYGARAFAKYLTEELGQNVIVNSTSGQVDAVRETINADADGYTICYVNNTVVINDLGGSTGFDSVNDVTLIASPATSVSSWIALRKDKADEIGVSDMKSLIEYTQANPDVLTISTNPNSSTDACIKLLRDKAGLMAAPVSAGTGTDRLTSLLSGACDIYVGNYGYLEQYIQTGEVVCFASCSKERSGFSPDIPCSYELGYEVEFPVTYYVCGPKDLPADVVEILDAAIAKVIENPEYIKDLEGNSNEPQFLDSAAITEFLTNQKAQLKEMGFGQ